MHRFQIPLKDITDAIPDELSSIKDLSENEDIEERVRLDGRYRLQHERLLKQMDQMKQEMSAKLPETLDYRTIDAISLECRQKLDQLKPLNLAAASRIEGITPEALLALLRYVKKENRIGL